MTFCTNSISTTREILDRVRRIETRLTTYILQQGHDTPHQKPVWLDQEQHVVIVSNATALNEILAVIPDEFIGETVAVFHGGVEFCGVLK